MAARKKSAEASSEVYEAPVDDYPERPYEEAKADPENTAKVEARGPDQIADYHEENPTLEQGPAQEAVPPTTDVTDRNPEVPEA